MLWDGWAHPQAIRFSTWKLFFDKNQLIDNSNNRPVLINLKENLRETRNHAKEHPDLVIQMMQMARQLLQSIKERSIPLSPDFGEPETPAQDPSWLK